ncbi:hypothetical protein HY250_03775 [Candidatus Azambacteria bacterium]|nr:hypothetical protein [Candidatus Azambacteria bacterium]
MLKDDDWKRITVFNEYGWGGYFIQHAPYMKVFIDGRMPHWADRDGNSAMKDYIKVFYGKDESARREVLERRKVNLVIVSNPSSPSSALLWGAHAPFFLRNIFNSALMRRINDFLTLGEEPVLLNQWLAAHHWDVVYTDATAVILRKK